MATSEALPARWLSKFYTLLAAIALCGTACAEEKKPAAAQTAKPSASGQVGAVKAPPPVPVKAVPVTVGLVINDVSAVGTLLANEAVTIRPEIDGLVTAINFTEGQYVKAGVRLVSLEPSELKARLAQAQADVVLDRQRYQRAKDLYGKKFISEQALEEARGNLSRSVARREEANARLRKTAIHAPFAGILGMRAISPGAYVKAGDNIVRLENISMIKLDFKVPEVFLARVKSNQEVQVRVDAFPQEEFSGRIYAIQPAIDEQTRTVWMRATVPNQSGKLRPGMFARVALVLERKNEALLVPEQAIVPKGNDTFVFKVVDGKAEIAKVKVGTRRPGQVEVLEGLAANDIVVTDGQIKLQPGAQVMVMGTEGVPAGGTKPAAVPGARRSGAQAQTQTAAR